MWQQVGHECFSGTSLHINRWLLWYAYTAMQPSQSWVVKYRPIQLDDLAGQCLIKNACESILRGEDELLNMLFKGPTGTGKSCAIDILCRSLFGESMTERVFQINASDERGINVVREKIKFFSSLRVGGKGLCDQRCPDLKMVVIDEVDNLTFDAQTALRNVIETSSRSTRFCMICINDSNVIDPIKSRCLLFPFSKILPHDILLQLELSCHHQLRRSPV